MRGLTVLALATGLLAVGGGPALAAEPERTAWYSAASAGPLTVPAPTLAEGDLRVSGTGSRPTAYATLLLTSPGTAGGELVLAVREGSALGTVEVAACPTRTSTWEAGGNQPFAQGPEYDCGAGSVFGSLSADGTSIAFPLDSTVQPSAGTISVALVPLPESTAPFSIDLGDPAYTPAEAEAEAGDAGAPPADAPADTPAEAPAEEPAAPADEPGLAVGGAEGPDAPVDDAPAPALAGVDTALPAAEPQAPALPEAPLAAGEPPAVPGAVLPGATLAAGGEDTAQGPRLLALLALVGVSAAAGYAAGQQRPAPRLLGGRARALPAGAAAPDAAVAVVEPPRAEQPRGIGRFSRVRDAAPRRLR